MARSRQVMVARCVRTAALTTLTAVACGGALFFVDIVTRPATEMAHAGARRTIAELGKTPRKKAKPGDPKSGDVPNASLTHDFGVVPPGSVVTCSYSIENTSDFAWTIDRVHVLCRCTVPGSSAPVIAPGQRESVTLQLNCGDDVADIVKAATVYFKEPAASPVRLLIKASVRAPMTPSVREVSFGSIAADEGSERAITLANFGAADWREVRIGSCPEWAEPSVSSAASTGAVNDANGMIGAPRQLWNAIIRVTRQPKAEGCHQAPILFCADSGDQCKVYVSVNVEPAVRIVPKSLVFGPARPNEACQRVARVIVQKGLHVSAIIATSDCEELFVDVRPINDNIWQIKATLVVPGHARVPDGHLSVSFAGGDLPDAALPYSFFQPPGAQ